MASELDTANDNLRRTNNDIHTLRTNLNDAQRILQDRTGESMDLQTRIQQLNGELQQAGADRATLQANLAAAEHALPGVTAERENYRLQVEQLQQQLQVNETHIAELQTQVTETNVECTALRGQLLQARTELQQAETQAQAELQQAETQAQAELQQAETQAQAELQRAEQLAAQLRNMQLQQPSEFDIVYKHAREVAESKNPPGFLDAVTQVVAARAMTRTPLDFSTDEIRNIIINSHGLSTEAPRRPHPRNFPDAPLSARTWDELRAELRLNSFPDAGLGT